MIAAEQKARTVYDNLLRIIDDPDVREPLKFLRAREIVHFQRFGEALEMTKDNLNCKNYYYFNRLFCVPETEIILKSLISSSGLYVSMQTFGLLARI